MHGGHIKVSSRIHLQRRLRVEQRTHTLWSIKNNSYAGKTSDRMHYIVLFAVLVASAFAVPTPQFYSFSPAVGSGSGASYSITGEGRITGIRMWEAYSNFIYGIQVRYDGIWSPVVGSQSGEVIEMELFDGEAIIQISGKYAHYIQSLVFVTSLGRSLHAGQPAGHSFNMYAAHKEAELRFISGRYHGALTALEAHWAVVDGNNSSSH